MCLGLRGDHRGRGEVWYAAPSLMRSLRPLGVAVMVSISSAAGPSSAGGASTSGFPSET